MNAAWRARALYHASRWVWVLGLAVLTEMSFPSSSTDIGPLLDPGAVADRDVIAPFNFVVNKTDEEIEREGADLAASVKPIYQFDQRMYDSATAGMHTFFSNLDEVSADGPQAIIRAARDAGVTLTLTEAAYLAKGGKRKGFERTLSDLFGQTLAVGVTGPGVLQAEQAPELIVRRRNSEASVSRTQVLSFPQYLTRAKANQPDKGTPVADPLYIKLAGRFFRPTLVPNAAETERRRDELRRSVNPSKYTVRAGDVIVAAHEVVTSEAHERLAALHQELLRRGAATSRSLSGLIGVVLRDSLIIGLFWVLMLFYRRETYTNQRQVAFVGVFFALAILGAAAVARSAPQHPELIPLPFVAIMFTVLFNGRVSMIAALILSALIGSQPVFHDVPADFLLLVGGVSAALSVKGLRNRSHLYIAVLVVGAGFLVGTVALGLALAWSLAAIGWRVVWGVTNGFVSAALTILLLPLAERATQVTTDLTLLELSDPSRPLLRRLSLEAPGTYAHSIAMANLVEAACNRVGANGLLGRVGCYYHDIGKLSNPPFFVENQGRSGNPHDRLKAIQSAHIIRAHITEGLVLARAAGLPEAVVAFIPEHHGTTEITYFLDRAKKEGEPSIVTAEFTYPGPKPRSIETAVSMLADSVEAALRVIDDLTPAKIEQAIEKIARGKISAGQLDDAPITLQQITAVKQEFVRVLSSMYHNRIDYPEASGGITAGFEAKAGA
ncbi:MAG TPA: HDIG domain-containing metalloprotein [Gemmatimonadales bacterium]